MSPGSGELDAFLRSIRPTCDGFAAWDDGDPWRLGAVLLARSEDGFAAVRKAPKRRYGFSGLWAMPGGMVRARGENAAFERDVVDSVRARVAAESGLVVECLNWGSGLGPVVTSYEVSGLRRYVIIVACVCDIPKPVSLKVSDTSIADAIWSEVPPPWAEFAPANRLILGHLLWGELKPSERHNAQPALLAALAECTEAAREIDWPAPFPPWEDASSLQVWRASWSPQTR